jgi:hypothetical protein
LDSSGENVDSMSRSVSVFPAQAGIQVLRRFLSVTTPDARRSLRSTPIGGEHDGFSPPLNATDRNHSRP